MSDLKGTPRVLHYLRRMMEGETLSVIGLLADDTKDVLTDATVRRALGLLETYITGVVRDAGRPANWRYVGVDAYTFCPFCGKKLK